MEPAAGGLSRRVAGLYLGVGYDRIMRLLREGKLRLLPDDSIELASLQAYKASLRPPTGYVSTAEAARRLGIAQAQIPKLVRQGVLKGQLAAGPRRDHWISSQDLSRVKAKPSLLAAAGVKIKVPKGWLSSAEACSRLKCGRSTLRWYVESGQLRRRKYSFNNTWYREQDVQVLSSNGATNPTVDPAGTRRVVAH